MTELELLRIIDMGGDASRSLIGPAITKAHKVGLIPQFSTHAGHKEEVWSQIEEIVKEFLTEAWRNADTHEYNLSQEQD
jgi:hypothetical protein